MTKKKKIKANTPQKTEAEIISRKEALKKAGKYAAFTAASMMFFFIPKKAQASSETPQNPGADW